MGAADPPRAGSLIWHAPANMLWTLNSGDTQSTAISVQLPTPPFTLEVVAHFSINSPHNAGWSVQLQTDEDQPLHKMTIYNNCTFALWGKGRTPFIHLQPGGLSNRLTLNVLADQSATLRLNDEIAWQGMLNMVTQQSIGWLISASAGNNGVAALTWEQMALYASP